MTESVSLESASAAIRIFTDAELRRIVTPAGDLACEAIETGDLAAAREICTAAKDMQRPLHDNYTIWHAHTLAYINRTYGLDAVHAALAKGIAPWLRAVSDRFRDGATREAIAYIVQIWRMYCLDFGPVTEDENCVSVSLAGSGDFFRADQGGNPASLTVENFALTAFRARQDGDPRVPLFACAILHAEKLMAGWLGYPAFVHDFQADGTPARLRIFKDPRAIPLAYFTRLGMPRDARRIGGAVALGGGRLFSDTELGELGRQNMQRAADALDRGDLAAAKGWAKLSKSEWYPAHHIHRDFITGMLGYLYLEHGVDGAYEAVQQGYEEPFVSPMMGVVEAMSLRERVEGLAYGFRQHAMVFRIEEHEDRFIFITEPCGSGGRLQQEGAYEEDSPVRFPRVRESHKGTFFLENFPVYCMHCPSTNRFLLGRGGPYYLLVDGELMKVQDGNCNFYIFKDASAVPDRFYNRAGLSRSECGSCH